MTGREIMFHEYCPRWCCPAGGSHEGSVYESVLRNTADAHEIRLLLTNGYVLKTVVKILETLREKKSLRSYNGEAANVNGQEMKGSE